MFGEFPNLLWFDTNNLTSKFTIHLPIAFVQVDAQKHTLAKYLMELTLPEFGFVKFDPSEIAAAALYLSMQLIEPDVEWVS